MKKFKRSLITNINKYQKRIIYPVLLCSAIICFVSILCLISTHLLGEQRPNTLPLNHTNLKIAINQFLVIISFLMVFVIFWTFYITNKIAGPYSRILKELDDTLANKKSGNITVRKGDEMFEELLKRINLLIEKTA